MGRKPLKALGQSRAVQLTLGHGVANYLKFVKLTSKMMLDPPDLIEIMEKNQPIIPTAWHGEHLLTPFLFRKRYAKLNGLVSRHRDGEVNALALKSFGIGAIRGAGAHNTEFFRKGGPQGFRQVLKTLKSGESVFITGDIPKTARVASVGLIKIAAYSGRPLIPLGVATRSHYQTGAWDRTQIPYPFNRLAFALEPLIFVPRGLDKDGEEEQRQALEEAINRASQRAQAMVEKQ